MGRNSGALIPIKINLINQINQINFMCDESYQGHTLGGNTPSFMERKKPVWNEKLVQLKSERHHFVIKHRHYKSLSQNIAPPPPPPPNFLFERVPLKATDQVSDK